MQNVYGSTALHIATRTRARQDEASMVVKVLVQGRADLTLRDKDTQTALHVGSSVSFFVFRSLYLAFWLTDSSIV